jgi:hypothetical protein
MPPPITRGQWLTMPHRKTEIDPARDLYATALKVVVRTTLKHSMHSPQSVFRVWVPYKCRKAGPAFFVFLKTRSDFACPADVFIPAPNREGAFKLK